MIKALCFALIIILTNIAHGRKEMAITIDDLPFLYGRYLPDSVENVKFRSIMTVLKNHKIQTIGFVVGSQIKAHESILLDEFIADGHIIGNHTYSHPDLNSTSIDWYRKDIVNGADAIIKWVGRVKYFRYPFLHQGPTEAKYRAISEFLKANSYVNVPVTIDNDDWLYNREYTTALKDRDSIRADSIGREYLAHMQAKTLYFDSLAIAGMHRDIKHILLIHMTELNSVYLDSLLTLFARNGWSFISPIEALTDDTYRMQDTYIGRNGISWFLRF